MARNPAAQSAQAEQTVPQAGEASQADEPTPRNPEVPSLAGPEEPVRDQADAAAGQHDQDEAAQSAGVLDAVLRTAVRSAAVRTATERAAVSGTAAQADVDGKDAEPQDEPDEDAQDGAAAGEGAEDAGDTPTARSPRRAPLVIGAAALLAAFAVWAAIQAHDLRSAGTTRNAALTDAATTQQVKRQVSHAINTIFSYNYASTAATKSAAQRLLTGPAVHQYDSLFKIVAQEAPAEHLVLTTTVSDIGVELLIGDRARLLVFADQRDTKMIKPEKTSYAGAMFAVTAVRRGGQWRIENIDTFAGG
jgi:Mce-associated membrane protein